MAADIVDSDNGTLRGERPVNVNFDEKCYTLFVDLECLFERFLRAVEQATGVPVQQQRYVNNVTGTDEFLDIKNVTGTDEFLVIKNVTGTDDFLVIKTVTGTDTFLVINPMNPLKDYPNVFTTFTLINETEKQIADCAVAPFEHAM